MVPATVEAELEVLDALQRADPLPERRDVAERDALNTRGNAHIAACGFGMYCLVLVLVYTPPHTPTLRCSCTGLQS